MAEARLFSIYAGHLGNPGRWRDSMGWSFHVRRWASLENGSPRWQLIQSWFGSVESIAQWLQWHGFLDEALAQVDAMHGKPLSVDGQCNGSLRDRGDELFGASDREGNLLLSLTDGAASFMILIYPNGPLPADGLNLNVEAYQDGAWVLHSQNRLMP